MASAGDADITIHGDLAGNLTSGGSVTVWVMSTVAGYASIGLDGEADNCADIDLKVRAEYDLVIFSAGPFCRRAGDYLTETAFGNVTGGATAGNVRAPRAASWCKATPAPRTTSRFTACSSPISAQVKTWRRVPWLPHGERMDWKALPKISTAAS